MYVIHFEQLMLAVNQAKGRKLTHTEVAKVSGVDKNAINRLKLHPEIVPSFATVEKLVIYFARELDISKRDALTKLVTIL